MTKKGIYGTLKGGRGGEHTPIKNPVKETGLVVVGNRRKRETILHPADKHWD